MSISVDRTSRDFDVLATANGGTEVEEIAKEHPEAVKRLHIDALGDFDLAAATEMAQSIGFYHADVDQAAQILLKMWRCFKDNDANARGNQSARQDRDPDDESTKQLSALDAKISLDDNASFRHDGWARFVDPIVPDPFEQRAREHGLHYVHLHGEVGVIGNGAGLVMSSLDAVSGAGEEQGTNIKPANFLDIGGGASAASWPKAWRSYCPTLRSNPCSSMSMAASPPAWKSPTASSKRSPSSAVPSRSLCASMATPPPRVCISSPPPITRISMCPKPMEGAAAKAAQLAGEATQSKEVR